MASRQHFIYSVDIFTVSDPLGLQLETEYIVFLNLGLGGVRDVASSSISHEQTQSNQASCFQTLDAVFPKDPQFRLFRDHSSCYCAGCKTSPCTSI